MKDNGLLERLRDAVVTVASGLELEAVLQNVVEAAATLLDARYAALGVIGEDDLLTRFVHTGFDGDLERVGHPPHGLGILGLVIREGKPLRLHDLSRHPEAVGFPDGHPPMRSFLGVPILVQDVVYGRLYITEKQGENEFTERDEQLATALAATAGAAVHNALLYGATRRRERSLDAIREISGEIVGGSSDDRVLDLIAERARELMDADVAVICVPRGPALERLLSVRAASGSGAVPAKGSTVTVDDSLAGEVMRRGRLVSARWVPSELASAMEADSGNTAVGVPLRVRGEPFGALTLAARRFGDEQRRLVETFADQASMMLEYSRTKEELERLLLVEERERIGRDLHDTVIQRLFATGLELQTLAARYERGEPDLALRLVTAADGLDDIITQIRATVFALQPPDIEEGATTNVSVARIRELAVGIVAECMRGLGFEPEVVLVGDPGRTVPSHIAAHMLVVVREGLRNVARHAGATAAVVEIEAGDAFVARVRDNGVGFVQGSTPGGSGLHNMRERARAVGGEVEVVASAEGGTVLEWRAPAAGP
jgi:signal transduction histidine kinase